MSKDVIKVVLNYKDEIRTIEIQQYAELKQIKKKAYELFYPIKTEIDIKYNNKSLSSLLEQSIGNIIGKKSFMKLNIISLPGITKSLKIKPIKKLSPLKIDSPSHKKIINDKINSLLTPRILRNQIAIKTDNKTKQNEIKKSNSSEKIKKENIEQKICKTELKTINYEDFHLKKNGKKKLPPIKIDNQEIKKDVIDDNKCSECLKKIFLDYCRNCNIFLCLKCSNNNHLKEGHKLIEIDDNEKVNISRYKEEINKNLYNCLNSFNNVNIEGENEEINIEEAKNKYEKLINNLCETCERFIENLNEEEEEEVFNEEEIKNEIEEKLNIINDELNNENYDEDIKENGICVFKELNKKDRIIKTLINDYKCDNSAELSGNKINKFFTDIENEIDIILFDLEEQIDLEKFSNLQKKDKIDF